MQALAIGIVLNVRILASASLVRTIIPIIMEYVSVILLSVILSAMDVCPIVSPAMCSSREYNDVYYVPFI